MKRKDWKIKSLKKGIYGKKFLLRERFLFLRKLFLRRNKYLLKKNLFFNYFFFNKFLTSYKLKKQNYFFKLLFKTKINKIAFFPEYSVSKNVFNKKIKFNSLTKKHNLRLFFLKNSYSNNVGLNYYLLDGKNNLNFINDLKDDDFLNLVHFKGTKSELSEPNEISFYFNYNLHNLCLLEIYKILVILHLKN